MKKRYRFSIDEPAPNIPAARDFSSLLSHVKLVKPWYAKPWFWGGTAVFTAVVSVVLWSVFQAENPLIPKVTVNAANNIVADNNIQTPVQEIQKNELPVKLLYIPEEKTAANSESVQVSGDVQNPVVSAPVITVDVAEEIPVQKQIPAFMDHAAFQWFGLPYDTLEVQNNQATSLVYLKNRSEWLQFAKDAWVDETGSPVTGPLKILYRVARNPAEMLFSGIYFNKENHGIIQPLENNGSFEIRALQNEKELKLAKGKSVLMNFTVNSVAAKFGGIQYNPEYNRWDNMYLGLFSGDSSYGQYYHPHAGYRLSRERGFWAWVRSIFRKPKYKKLPESELAGTSYSDYAGNTEQYYRLRTFEIRNTGWFGSGVEFNKGGMRNMNFHYSLNTADSILPVIYQIFPDRNMIIPCDANNNVILYTGKYDRCILLAFCKNRNRVAVLTADEFDRDVKSRILSSGKDMARTGERDIMLKVIKTPVFSVSDLQKIIQIASQKGA